MTTTAFISMLVALILLIVAIGRVQGSPKTTAKLLFALAFGVVVGLGISSKKDSCKSSTNDTKIEMTSNLNQIPMQSLLTPEVTSEVVVANKIVGKVIDSNEPQGDLQQVDNHFTYAFSRDSPIPENSS